MGLLAWIIIGLAIGAIVKTMAPHRITGGWLSTLSVGVAGALIGGLIGNFLFNANRFELWTPGALLLALVGAFLLTGILSGVTNRRRNS